MAKGRRSVRQIDAEIRAALVDAFATAKSEGLYIGMGWDANLPDTQEAQEGPLITRLRKLIEETS